MLDQQSKNKIIKFVMVKFGHLFPSYTHPYLKDLTSFIIDRCALYYKERDWKLIDKDEDKPIRFTGEEIEEITEEDIEN